MRGIVKLGVAVGVVALGAAIVAHHSDDETSPELGDDEEGWIRAKANLLIAGGSSPSEAYTMAAAMARAERRGA
ncbi:MAG: hypothetical protein ACHREM_21630 [Polyangiales bacterium]